MLKLLIDIHPADVRDGDAPEYVIDVVLDAEHKRYASGITDIRDAVDNARHIARAFIDEKTGRIIEADDIERIDNDANGNPRHVVHWTTLGTDGYAHDERTKRAGLSKYSGKKYGGMFIVHDYGTRKQIADELTRIFYPETKK